MTPAGKAIVAHNAVKHGLLARVVLLPGDGSAAARALTELATSMRTELKPEGPLQHALVDRIVASLWRLQRLAQVESGLLACRLYRDEIEAAAVEARLASTGETWADDLERRYAPLVRAGVLPVSHGTRYQAALTATRRAELKAARPIPRLGRAFVAEERSFATLSRYEAGMERSLYKALHQLERLQRLRAGDAVPAPQAVDVNMEVDVRVSSTPGVAVAETTRREDWNNGSTVEDEFRFEP